jgi:DNA-binding NtrC family response regulator
VADDDADLRGVIAEYLSRAGYEVLQAANGLETLMHVKHRAPVAVVLDIAMPRLGGLEALKHIHAFNSAIAVIVVSGVADADVRRRALALGARAVLDKPLVLPELLTALERTPGAPTPPPPATRSGPPASRPPRAPAEVLVVDDDDGVRSMLEEFLATRGYRVRSAASAAEALRAISVTPPAVVLLDIEMPGLQGSDALVAIRAVAPKTIVIMVSGVHDAALASETLARGAFDYVVKPVDLAYLTQSLEAAIAAAGLQDERTTG